MPILGRTQQPLSLALRALAIDGIDRAGTVSGSSLHPEKRRERLAEPVPSGRTRAISATASV
jgi:hypothetical protein